MQTVHLIGGGEDSAAAPALFGPFLDSAGRTPVVATVVVDEGSGRKQYRRFAEALTRTARCEPVPVLIRLGRRLNPAALGDADALLVCGGLTPGYVTALAPVAGQVQEWLAAGDRPYAGFSAGAAVAAGRAVVGGWRVGGAVVCPPDAAEGLDEVAVVPGLDLVPWTVEVHCAQWGTLPRLLAALGALGAGDGLAIDEDTAVHLDGDGGRVAGAGAAWRVAAGDSVGPLSVVRLPSGSRIG